MLDKPRESRKPIPRCKWCRRDLRLGSIDDDYCSDDCAIADEEPEEVSDAKP